MKLALIVNNIVTRLIIGELANFPGWADVTGVYIGEGFTDNLDGTFTDNRAPVLPPAIRVITTQAFFRRMTLAERRVLRESVLDTVVDLREDLQRSVNIDLDDTIEQQLLDTTLVSQARINQLLVDGTAAESA